MSSYRRLLYHLVIRTKYSKHVLHQDHVRDLYSYLTGIIRKKNSTLYRINGVEDHIHILTDIHPSIAVADFMRDIKACSSLWMKESGKFPGFDGWSDGYAALTCSYLDIGVVIDYIRSQQEHHKKSSFDTEYRKLLMDNGIQVDERYYP